MEQQRQKRARRRRLLPILFLFSLLLAAVAVAPFTAGPGDAGDVRNGDAAPSAPPAPVPARTPAGPTTSTRAHGGRTVGDPPAVAFTIAGAGRGVLYPGGAAVPVELTFTNPNAAPIVVTSATVRVTGTSAEGCAAADFLVARQLAAAPTVPADTTASLHDLGVPVSSWPELRMADAGSQDACKGATVHLAFSGAAEGGR